MFWVLNILVGIVAGLIDLLLGFGHTSSTYQPGTGFAYSAFSNGPTGLIVWLLLLIPNLAVAVRRLHDTDRSGWWLLLIFLPILGWLALFVFYCLDGTRGPNRFGTDPKDLSDRRQLDEVFR